MKFLDQAKIYIRSGSGGAVAIADLDVADMAGISAQDFVAL